MASRKPELSPTEATFLKKLIADYPSFRFRLNAKRFSFRSSNGKTAKSTIFIGPLQPYFALLTLHELGHALCNHKDYNLDISRLKIESEAWERAKTVYLKYQKSAPDLLPYPWNEDFVQDSLDTYRGWLHQKSLCKTCGLTRYQTSDGKYHCPRCENLA